MKPPWDTNGLNSDIDTCKPRTKRHELMESRLNTERIDFISVATHCEQDPKSKGREPNGSICRGDGQSGDWPERG
jgi:hypothetical protein